MPIVSRRASVVDRIFHRICTHPNGKQWVLGAGSFGRVLKAKLATRSGEKDVAMKVLSQGELAHCASLDQFSEPYALLFDTRDCQPNTCWPQRRRRMYFRLCRFHTTMPVLKQSGGRQP